MIPAVARRDSRRTPVKSSSRAPSAARGERGGSANSAFQYIQMRSHFEPTNVIVWSGRGELKAALPKVWIGPQTQFLPTVDNENLRSAPQSEEPSSIHMEIHFSKSPSPSSSDWFNVSGRWLDIADVTSLCEPIRRGAAPESDNGALDRGCLSLTVEFDARTAWTQQCFSSKQLHALPCIPWIFPPKKM